jgi:hypothetical protein
MRLTPEFTGFANQGLFFILITVESFALVLEHSWHRQPGRSDLFWKRPIFHWWNQVVEA